MDTYAVVNARRQNVSEHVIGDISYATDRLDCTCGAVMRAAGAIEWMAHRRAVGQPVSLSVILGPAKARKALRVAM